MDCARGKDSESEMDRQTGICLLKAQAKHAPRTEFVSIVSPLFLNFGTQRMEIRSTRKFNSSCKCGKVENDDDEEHLQAFVFRPSVRLLFVSSLLRYSFGFHSFTDDNATVDRL